MAPYRTAVGILASVACLPPLSGLWLQRGCPTSGTRRVADMISPIFGCPRAVNVGLRFTPRPSSSVDPGAFRHRSNAPNCGASPQRDDDARAASPGHRGGGNDGAIAAPWPSLSAALIAARRAEQRNAPNCTADPRTPFHADAFHARTRTSPPPATAAAGRLFTMPKSVDSLRKSHRPGSGTGRRRLRKVTGSENSAKTAQSRRGTGPIRETDDP